MYAYAHVPAGFDGDAAPLIEAQIERFAPGFRERILARHVRSTAEIAAHNPNYVGGDIVTGANTARQLIFRPRPSLDPYWLGIPGVYLCSAATPPGAGAHGMCGFNAARSALSRIGAGPRQEQPAAESLRPAARPVARGLHATRAPAAARPEARSDAAAAHSQAAPPLG